jgi:hypothetical protein
MLMMLHVCKLVLLVVVVVYVMQTIHIQHTYRQECCFQERRRAVRVVPFESRSSRSGSCEGEVAVGAAYYEQGPGRRRLARRQHDIGHHHE